MLSLLRLIRIQKLLSILLLQIFIRIYFIGPILRQFGLGFGSSNLEFALMLIMTLCIAAGGYVINDYFDLKADYINRPKEVIVGREVQRRQAMVLHLLLSGLGIVIGLYLAWRMHVWVLALLPVFTVGLLWFYSTEYKRQFIIGNIVIAALSVFPIAFAVLYEPQIFRAYFDLLYREAAVLILKVLSFYGGIAFALSLIYALIKDLHDRDGDEQLGFRTLPIVAGTRSSNVSIIIISAVVLYGLFYIQNLQLQNASYVPLVYILFAIELPLILVNALILLQGTERSYKLALRISSAILLSGVFSIVVLNFFS